MSLKAWFAYVWRAIRDFSVHPLGSNLVGGLLFTVAVWLFWQITGNIYLTALALVIFIVLIAVFGKYLRTAKKIVFVSAGGTCRDPMAKVIANKLVEKMSPGAPITIDAAGLRGTSSKTASHAAKTVIRELYGEDLLATHKPKVLTEQLARESDLILVMDQSLLREDKCTLKGWPSAYGGKVYLFKEFFGLDGDVTDPWPDGKDEKTLARYRACAIEMRETMEKNFDSLLRALHG